MPTVLITGASRGIGRAAVLRLAEAGWEVLAGVRRAEDGSSLEDEAPAGRVEPLLLDLTDQGDLDALPSRLPERLDAVVNNAGIVVYGPVEGLSLDALRRQLDVNVVAQVGVTQAVLPRLRAARGRVVFVSSFMGRVCSPMMGAYGVSKFALEGIADALRVELRPWGMRVVLVEPGAIDTDLWRGAQTTIDEAEAALAPAHLELYGRHLAGGRRSVSRMQKQLSPVAKVADAILTALTAKRPRARYVVGPDAHVQVALRAALPTPAFDLAVAKVTGTPG
jgi:NAD(P)-dependent dehydrogenase (short-subunit alcohol dehydrogenase family)